MNLMQCVLLLTRLHSVLHLFLVFTQICSDKGGKKSEQTGS